MEPNTQSVPSEVIERVTKKVRIDTSSPRCEYLIPMPSFLEDKASSIIKNTRDMPTVQCLFNIHLMMMSIVFVMFFIYPNHYLGLLYVTLSIAIFLKRFILMLHYSQHTSPFQKEYSWINTYISYCISPFFGIPPGQYYLHHVIMHHVENNIFPWDVSSTMTYQRDNFLHFLQYFFRYTFAIWVELPYYAYKRGRYSMAISSVLWSTSYLMVVYLLSQLNFIATLWMLIIPFFVSSFLLMLGNWSQHMFVKAPGSDPSGYAITYNIVNSIYNRETFNDGYHITHHENSILHWSEMPERFLSNLPKYIQEDALIFEGLDYFIMALLTFTGQLHRIAKHYVNIQSKARSEEEIIQLLKDRLTAYQI